MSLSAKDWKEITAPLYKVGLSATGFCNKLPSAIRHGTTSNIGLHLPCMYLTQGIMKLIKYMSNINSTSILGQMMRLCEENIKLELGLPGNLYSHLYKKSHFLTSTSWIKHQWKFVQDNNITLQDNTPPLSHITDKDQFLMEIFLGQSFHKRDLIRLNKRRKYLKVMTIGDILNGSGTKVLKEIKYGQRSPSIRTNSHWPY